MELICKNCDATILAGDVNIATDLAKCSACGTLQRASELQERVSLAQLLVPPTNGRIQLLHGLHNNIELLLPAKGVDSVTVVTIIFAMCWLTFVGIWTFFASMTSFLFTMFSIPFWVVGLGMVINSINSTREVQKITFNQYELVIEVLRPLFGRRVVLSTDEVLDVTMQQEMGANLLRTVEVSSKRLPNDPKPDYPTIVTKGKNHYFFERLTEQEQRWAVRLLRHVLVKKK